MNEQEYENRINDLQAELSSKGWEVSELKRELEKTELESEMRMKEIRRLRALVRDQGKAV